MSVHFSSKTVEWSTPQSIFEELNNEFRFTLDPCSTDDNTKCINHYTEKDDGLTKSWSGEIVFMNPPYGREIKHWMRKAFLESRCGSTVVCLIPSRTDTAWWHEYVMESDDIRFIRGRLKFGGHKNSAPFPSAIVVFKPC